MAHRASPGAAQSWQQVHHLLAERAGGAATLAELTALGCYYYHRYKAFGHLADALTARRLLARLATQLGSHVGGSSLASHADYACTLAWLAQHLQAEGHAEPLATACLAGLDQALLPLALQARQQPANRGRHAFFRILRYFDLRRPGARPLAALQLLLAPPLPACPGPGGLPTGQPLSLGLADGLAYELLTISRLATAGIADQPLRQYMRQGIQWLLTLRQPVDFPGRRYALFPHEVQGNSPQTGPGPAAELSWRRGDMGQALLLHTASNLFADTELANLAELVGLNTLLRTTPEATGITDATFQRGAAGVAQLYYRLHVASNGLPKYYQGYLFWLHETERWLSQELAAGFYQTREASLREGLPGVGLVLLAAATGTGHNWDDLLL